MSLPPLEVPVGELSPSSNLSPLSPISTIPFAEVYDATHSLRHNTPEWLRYLNFMFSRRMTFESDEDMEKKFAVKKAASEKVIAPL